VADEIGPGAHEDGTTFETQPLAGQFDGAAVDGLGVRAQQKFVSQGHHGAEPAGQALLPGLELASLDDRAEDRAEDGDDLLPRFIDGTA